METSFLSTDKIRSVYAFVRNSLRDDIKPNKFVLCMWIFTVSSLRVFNTSVDQTPPRRELKVSDPKVRDLTLFQLQLAPSSVLLLSFLDESLNGAFSTIKCILS